MSKEISIYIHWPFCLSLCPYCDFNSHVMGNVDYQIWLDAYLQEIKYFESKIKNKQIKSIFFGGGTPSLMKPQLVESIINKLASIGIINNLCEITLEANPTSFESKKFVEFKLAGINRVSIGVQSFDNDSLVKLGRKHSSHEAISAIEEAARLFNRYSFDLIYARPDQTLADWQEELKFATNLTRDHLSLYQLTIEKATPFFNLYRSGKLKLPSSELSANLYSWTNNFLTELKYNRYEISNYAKIGSESIHNLCYWYYDEYIGIGPGAHSRIHDTPQIRALMMYHKPAKWLEHINNFGNGIQNNVKLKQSEIVEEVIMMSTRLQNGLDENKLKNITGLTFADILNQQNLEHYLDNGLLSINNNFLKLSDKGILMHNYLIPRLIK